MEKTLTFDVKEDGAGKRLDIYVARKFPEMSRSRIKGLIEKGLVRIGGLTAKAGRKLKAGEKISVTFPPPLPATPLAEPIALDFLYEDGDIIVINKPQGLTVHPGAGRSGGTLVSALLHHTKTLSDIGGPLRPGIVHRLDKDTSGVLIIAKTNFSHLHLINQFKEHSVKRTYHALVWGTVATQSGVIDRPIGRDLKDRKKFSTRVKGGKPSLTRYRVLKRWPHFTLIEVTPGTGRTHQIRVHMSSIKHPLAGDPVYGGKRNPPMELSNEITEALKGLKGQSLHATSLGITHPVTGKHMEFSSPYPAALTNLIKLLGKCAS